jgi:flagellar operon protein
MDAITKNFALHQVTEAKLRPISALDKTSPPPVKNFNEVLFSKHAALRLSDRDLKLTGDQLERVESAISKANKKGIRDSLVLVDDMALIVNIKSKTVITAMNQNNNHVFSNIDGAVIV